MSQFDTGLAIGFILGAVVMLIAMGLLVIRARENLSPLCEELDWYKTELEKWQKRATQREGIK